MHCAPSSALKGPMTASQPPPPTQSDTPTSSAPARFDDPLWTDARRTAFWDAARRVGLAILLAAGAAGWTALVLVSFGFMALGGVGDVPNAVVIGLFLPTVVLFALSVKQLVEPSAPPALRIMGIICGFLGAVLIVSIVFG